MPRTATFLLLALFPSLLKAQVDAESLRRGLFVTYRDAAKPVAASVTRLEPTIALSLRAKEAAHPRLSSDGGTVRWQGYLNVSRADTYRFRVRLSGSFRLRIDDKEVLSAEVKEGKPQFKEGKEIRLESGLLPLSAEFTRLGNEARVEVLWESKHFHEEPLPFDVVGHIQDKAPPEWARDTTLERGRRLVEEHGCIQCHRPGDQQHVALTLQSRHGPDLSKVGQRVQEEWLYRWLDDPRKMRPASVMPRLFGDGAEGANERYAVTRFLVSLGGPCVPSDRKPSKQQLDQSVQSGQQLFSSVGCIVCHGPIGDAKPMKAEEEERTFTLYKAPTLFPFKGMGVKTTPERLTAFLRDPRSIHPTSRMPNMLLDEKEANDLAWFLCEATVGKARMMPDAPAEAMRLKCIEQYVADVTARETIKKLPEEKQWIELGKRIVEAKGCVACHTIAPEGKALPTFTARSSLEKLTTSDAKQGCLSDDDKKHDKSPLMPLDAKSRADVRTFLNDGLRGAGSKAPTYLAMTTLERLNCLACHQREGEGGLSTSLVEQMRKYEKAENAEAVMPPPLTGVGHKLRTPWIREVLTKAGRARPWMSLRMPQFGEAHVGALPEALASLEGTDADEPTHKATLTTETIGAGKFLVGKQAFGCISCHDIAGRPNFGTRGPDLATMTERTRYDWYTRWLHDAQRMQPGTRMPSVFPDGKSQIASILKGSAAAQSDAMWAYLSLGPTLPLPEGMESIKGLVLSVKDRPRILRSFLPDAGTRAIAVGYPDGLSLAFDAETCRLAYAWTGNFLDVSPVWNERGGNPALLLGKRIWTSPVGCAWELGTKEAPPDFATRAEEPGFGGKLPEGKVLEEPHPLKFEGFTLNRQGEPTFSYQLTRKGKTLQVQEQPAPLRARAGVGVKRSFDVTIPTRQTAWMHIGESADLPRVFDDRGKPVPAADGEGRASEWTTSHAILITQGEGKLTLLRILNAPKDSRWRIGFRAGRWEVQLRVPGGDEPSRVTVAIWIPHFTEPLRIAELLAERP